MQIIKPTLITEAMLVSSTIAESEHPAWNAATAYTLGARVIHAHQVWERLVAGATPGAPDADTTNWIVVGPTNRWAMFDQRAGTASASGSDITAVLRPGLVRAIALLDITATSVTVAMSREGVEIYRREVGLNTGIGVIDAYTYCFGEIVMKRTVVLTDLLPYGDAEITITISGSTAVSVGTCVLGGLQDLGGTRQGMQLGILDYSVKQTSEFGVTTLKSRDYAPRITVPIAVRRQLVSHVARKLSEIRATPIVWIGSALDDATVVYGYYKDWSLDMQYNQIAFGSINIEGLA